jgi:endogenous inhibitor of DNA gyrase (YacG/DUF329 family)
VGALTGQRRDRYDDAVPVPVSTAPRLPRCPRCRAHVAWQNNPHRPFCSLPCRLIDLGVWLDERYRIAGAPLPGGGDRDEDASPDGE